MNHTTNYQLSQWESTDRILMSDFNSDNAKIDAALKTNADNIAALEAVKGNCHVSYHTYVGDRSIFFNRSNFTDLSGTSRSGHYRRRKMPGTACSALGSITVSAWRRKRVRLAGHDHVR